MNTLPVAHQNPLDRNHDGRVDLADLTARNSNAPLLNGQGLAPGMTSITTSTTTAPLVAAPLVAAPIVATNIIPVQTAYVQSERRASLVRAEPTIIETIEKDVVVHERIHPVQKEEIQPIIYREREQLDVRQVTQMMHETQIRPTVLEQRELPAEHRRDIVERSGPITPNFVAASKEVDATLRTQVVHAPIVNEVIRKTVLEEIQPVLERDVYQSTVIQNTQPIYEKIIEAPSVTREIREVGGNRLSQGYTQAQLTQTFTDSTMLEQNRRLSRGYEQPILGQQTMLSQQTVLTQQPMIGQQSLHQRRLSQTYVEQPILAQTYNQTYETQGLQNRRLSQNLGMVQPMPFGVNTGPVPMAGMNNTGIGMASAVPLNTVAPMMNNHLARGFNEQPNVYNSGFHANNLITSVGLTGSHSVAGSVDSTIGGTMPRNLVMQPVSVLEANLAGNRLSQGYALPQEQILSSGQVRYASNSSYGLQGTPVYQNTVEEEKLREFEREQALLRQQQTPNNYRAF